MSDVTLEVLRLKFASCEKYPNTVLKGLFCVAVNVSLSNIVISTVNILHTAMAFRLALGNANETRLDCGGV